MNNPLRYVNAAYKKRERKKINTLMFQKHKSVWYKLSRSVLPGTELIVDYGDVYFDNEVEQEDKEDLWRFTIIPESKSQKRRRRRKELKKKNK